MMTNALLARRSDKSSASTSIRNCHIILPVRQNNHRRRRRQLSLHRQIDRAATTKRDMDRTGNGPQVNEPRCRPRVAGATLEGPLYWLLLERLKMRELPENASERERAALAANRIGLVMRRPTCFSVLIQFVRLHYCRAVSILGGRVSAKLAAAHVK